MMNVKPIQQELTPGNQSPSESPQGTIENLNLNFHLDTIHPNFLYAHITVPQRIVSDLYNQAAYSAQRTAHVPGFNHGDVPLSYIKDHFKDTIIQHIKELLLKHCVLDFLYHKLRTDKIVIAGLPQLTKASVNPETDAQFIFELSAVPPITIYEWRYLPFKAPRRKNYKDLDRQAELLIKDEKNNTSSSDHHTLAGNDWVHFKVGITNHEGTLLFGYLQEYWFKLGDEESDNPLRELFLGKKVGDSFLTYNKDLQQLFSSQFDTHYHFYIEIIDSIPHSFFCLEQFKRHFRIKTNKELHQKLIEVFSYRNDISQRRCMVEDSLNLLFSKHQIAIPNHLIVRQQHKILEDMHNNPDYHVYRAQKDFESKICQLAEKQTKENIFIDHLAYHENITVSDQDIKGFLNLTNRARMKEFIYFNLPSFKVEEQEIPIPVQDIKNICLREKTINYIIYHLTKK